MKTLQRLDNLSKLSPRPGRRAPQKRNVSFNASEIMQRSPQSLMQVTNLSFEPVLSLDNLCNDSTDSFANDDLVLLKSNLSNTDVTKQISDDLAAEKKKSLALSGELSTLKFDYQQLKLEYDKIRLTIDKLLAKVYPYAADIKGQSLAELKQLEILYLKEKQF